MASLSKASSEKEASWNVLVRVVCGSHESWNSCRGHHLVPSTSFLPLQRKGQQLQGGCVLGLVSFDPNCGPLGV